MRKRQMTKQIVIAAIGFTIFIIWRRQLLLPGDTSGKEHDGNMRFVPGSLPRSQNSMVAERPESTNDESISHEKPEYLGEKLDNEEKFHDNFEKKDEINDSKENSELEYVMPDAGKIEHEIVNSVTRINEHGNEKNVAGKISETVLNFDQIHQTSRSTVKPFSKNLTNLKLPHEDDLMEEEDDDLDESNFVNFIFQKNFRRRGEDLSQNLSRSVNLAINQQKVNPESEIISSREERSQHPPENVLLKENRTFVKDDRNEFFGQMPSFDDYSLPVLKDSVQNKGTEKDRNVQKTVSIQNNNTLLTEQVSSEPETEIADEVDDEDDDRPVDETMEGVLIIGSVNASQKYAVFSATTEGRSSLSYIFYLPLTAFAWKRIGFDSIVIIVGSKSEWDSDPLLYHVLSALKSLDCVIVFLEPRSEKSVMISQVARIFVANILRSAFPNIDNVYIVTSDADLWPIYGNIYNLTPGKKVLSLNSDCCSPFKHRGTTYKMLPMANVGMTVRTWRKLTRKFDESPRSIDDIFTIFVQEFGTVALRPVRKGDNVGWYLDQMMMSILIAKWIKERGAKTVKFVPRDVGVDRIDRAGWSYGQNDIDDKVDAHLLLEAYIPGVWVRITHLLRLMYGDMTQQYLWCVNYYEEFQKQFLSKYRVKQS